MINITTFKDPKSPIAEAYRSIRTNIQFSKIDNEMKTIVVTSSQQNEGKSTVIANLAVSFAGMENKKILILEGDLRNPTVHRMFNISNTHGITDILTGQKSFDLGIDKGLKQEDERILREYLVKELRYISYLDYEPPESKIYYKLKEDMDYIEEDSELDFDLQGLLDAYRRVLDNISLKEKKEGKEREESLLENIRRDEFSVEEGIDFVIRKLRIYKNLEFSELFEKKTNKYRIVTIFMAILELIKERKIEVKQSTLFGEIRITALDIL